MSDIIVGSVGVRLVPNAEGFTAKAKAATQGLTANVRVDADTAPAKAKIDDAARDRKAKIEANADTAVADAELDRAAHTRTVRFRAETSGIDRVVNALDNVPKGFGLLGTAIVGLGPALVPVAAAAAGLTAALGAPLAAAGGGATLYALIAGKAVKDTEKQSKAIDQLKKKMDAAKVSAQSATTAAGKKSALATLATDTKAYNDALDKLNPAQAQFIQAQNGLKGAFTNLERSSGAAIFGPLTQGMKALADLLPKVGPVLKPVSAAIGGLLGEVDKSAKSGALADFLHFLAQTSGPAITQAGHILGNVALGFAGIGKAFSPLGKSVGDALLHWSAGFAKIGASKGLSDFVSYVRSEGPQVASTLGDVARAVGHIVTALAPIGHISLSGIDGIAKGVSAIPTRALTVAAGAFASIALSMKAIALAKGGLSALGAVAKFAGMGGKGAVGVGATALGDVAGKGVVPVYVTNEGFGPPGAVGAGGRGAGAAGGEAGAAGAIGSGLGSVGILGSIGIGGFGFASSLAINNRNKKADNGGLAAAIAADKAAAATKRWKEQEAGLADLLLGPAVPTHLHNLKALPPDVRTKIETPGAVESVAQISALARKYDLTPKQVRTLVQASGVDKANSQVAQLGHLYGLTPKQVRTLISQAGMDSSQSAIRRLANLYDVTPKQVRTIVTAQAGSALAAIARIRAELASIPRSISTSYYVNQVNSISKRYTPGAVPGSADGSMVPKDGGPYSDRFLYRLAPGEEIISNRHGEADRFRAMRAAGMIPGLATGGTAGARPGWAGTGWGSAVPPWWQKFMTILGAAAAGGRAPPPPPSPPPHPPPAPAFSYSLADQSSIVGVQQQIRDLTKQLNAHGKNKLEGLDRKAAEINLKLAQQQLADAKNAPVKALRDALSGGFNVDSALGKQPANPVTAGVRDAIGQFKQQVVDAGGTWTKHLRDLTSGMVKHALAIDKDNRALDRANTQHDALTSKLSDLTSQMDTLTSTMSQFGSSVGGNFLSNPFGLGGQSSTFTPTVQNSPALSAATDQLNAAKAHLAALSTGGGDINTRLANAFAAQGVAGDVAKLQAQVDQLSQPVTTVTDSLQAFRDTLKSDTQRALDFNTALTTLSQEGLNTDLFSQLAQSGDVGFAQELAAAGQSAVSDINTLWNTRATAAAQVAALATQTVYGQQQAVLQGQITRQNALISSNQASIDRLNAQVATLGQRVENGAKNGVAGIEGQIAAMQKSIDAIPRQLAHYATR